MYIRNKKSNHNFEILSHKCATEEHLHNKKFFNTDTYPIKSGSHDSSGKSLNATINNGTLTHNYEHPM